MKKKQPILIVDDSSVNREMLTLILSEEYELITASDGTSALETLEDCSYNVDLILLDIVMPDIDGFEVCRILKTKPESKNIPIIMLSALDSSDSKLKGFEVGAVDYITKPFYGAEVLARVHTHIELYHLQKELVRLVDEKTDELLENEKLLYQNAKMAELGTMIAMIAHQWRQPLNAINADAMMLFYRSELNPLTPEEIREISESIQMYTKSMSETIQDFMNFSAPEIKAGNFTLENVFSDLLKLIKKRDVNFQLNIDPNIVLFGYKREFLHVMLNLLSNALDAVSQTDQSDKTITINADQKDRKIKISICDNGTGIDPEILPKIFDPYFTTKEEGKGTGIGLYMVNEILSKKFNATIQGNNREEGGICFEISLPGKET